MIQARGEEVGRGLKGRERRSVRDRDLRSSGET